MPVTALVASPRNRLHIDPELDPAQRKSGPAVNNCRACFLRHVSRDFCAGETFAYQNRVTHPLADRAKKGLEVLQRLGIAALTPYECRRVLSRKFGVSSLCSMRLF